MKTITFRQCVAIVIAIILSLLAWRSNSVNGAQQRNESGAKPMECNEYFFFRNASMV